MALVQDQIYSFVFKKKQLKKAIGWHATIHTSSSMGCGHGAYLDYPIPSRKQRTRMLWEPVQRAGTAPGAAACGVNDLERQGSPGQTIPCLI